MSIKLILVINCGSSSLKFAIVEEHSFNKKITGIAESLNSQEAKITWTIDNHTYEKNLLNNCNHSYALTFLFNEILNKIPKIDTKLIAIGHRIVHGGEQFTKSVIITDLVIKGINDAIPFAPLHNPAHLIGINNIIKLLPNLADKNVAVFDTAFHQTIPEKAYLYAIPYDLYNKYGIRRYGAHGISHFYVSNQAAIFLNKSIKKLNLITCHLGNGGSISAINNGKCIDTSMGLTPLEGIVMGTRSGNIDPAIIFYLYNNIGMSIENINILLTKKSGFLGLTNGITSDCRYIENNYTNLIPARRAMDVYCYSIAKYIGAYSVLMSSKLDAIIFTGGIGENSILVRKLVLSYLTTLGFQIDDERNSTIKLGKTGIITTEKSQLAIVIPTNEELVIAKETSFLLNN